MDVGPLLPGQIPNSLIASRLLSNLQDSQRALTQMQEQISTGKQYSLPSENPSAAIRTIGLQQLLEQKTQVSSNIATDKSLLSATDQPKRSPFAPSPAISFTCSLHVLSWRVKI